MSVNFKDNRIEVVAALDDAAIAFLYEAAGELQAAVKRNTAVKTGQLKNSWDYVVDESKKEATIGSPLQNAIWEEFGTGEYALNGDGRKGGWKYVDEQGEGHFTYGKKPKRALSNAFTSKQSQIIKRAESLFKEGLK